MIIKDPHDSRDLIYTPPAGVQPLPCDYRHLLYGIENQHWLQSCGGWSASTEAEAFLRVFAPAQAEPISARFFWYNALDIVGRTGLNDGVPAAAIMKAWKKYGACPARLCPDDDALMLERPSPAAYRAARQNRIGAYARLRSVQDMKLALSAGIPAVFIGIRIPAGFDTIHGPEAAHPEHWLRVAGNPTVSKHFMTAMGHTARGIILVDSNGLASLDNGCTICPDTVFARLQMDMWVPTRMRDWFDPFRDLWRELGMK